MNAYFSDEAGNTYFAAINTTPGQEQGQGRGVYNVVNGTIAFNPNSLEFSASRDVAQTEYSDLNTKLDKLRSTDNYKKAKSDIANAMLTPQEKEIKSISVNKEMIRLEWHELSNFSITRGNRGFFFSHHQV